MSIQRIAYARIDEPGKNRNRIAMNLNRFGEMSWHGVCPPRRAVASSLASIALRGLAAGRLLGLLDPDRLR
jgi:hypothetical protein